MILVTIPSSSKDVGEMFSSIHAEEKLLYRTILSTVLTAVCYLGAVTISQKKNSNFIFQLLNVRADKIVSLKKWMTKSQDKYTSPDIQNNIFSIMGLSVLRNITDEAAGKYCTIMIDEATDTSNTEQMVFVCTVWMTKPRPTEMCMVIRMIILQRQGIHSAIRPLIG